MKKKFLNIIPIIIGGAMMFSVGALAASGKDVPGESVYGSKAEQDAVYEIIQNSEDLRFLKDNGIIVLSESIMPIYEASLLEYAETGVFAVRPNIVLDNGAVYVAKTTTTEGVFVSDLRFYVKDGAAYHLWSAPPNNQKKSHSYADHAERIQSLTNKESFVPIGEVRYVAVDRLGYVFYVNDGKTEALVNISAADDVFYKKNREIIYVGEELKKIADERLAEQKAFLMGKAAWEAANPGKEWTFTGDGRVATSTTNGYVDDIVNIVEYLGIDDSDVYFTSTTFTTTSATPSTTNTYAWLLLVAIPIVVFAIFMGLKLIRKSKKAESADIQSDDN
ncbi:MAG: hypothetical protein LBI54_08510 [Lachnospiraceae bacterium]|nr:hypothetical protein [Lachnospiraceae bacterium]